ncbi:Dbl homology domain-containing protein, partial [Nadsonia fulvescens var. elongata DSM 6958]
MDNQEEFWQNAFAFIPAIIDCNTKLLLNPLKYRQKEEGPFIKSIADIFLSWTKVAEAPFVQYAKRYLYIDTTLRQKRENNLNFRAWLDKVGKDSRVRMPYSFYFHRVLPRLARYSLLLQTIGKNTLNNEAEMGLLTRAIKECDGITSSCDSSIAQVEKNIELTDIKNKILWKSSYEKVNLGLKNPGRKVIKQGDVTRRGNHRVDWIETHLILLDNYLLISKIRNGSNGSKYYVTKRPIPLELLVLESCSDDPVTKSSSSKLGVGTFTSAVSSENKRHSRQFFNNPTSPTN